VLKRTDVANGELNVALGSQATAGPLYRAGKLKERSATFGYETFPATREQVNAFIQSESARYADVIKRAKASLD
jgi:tripartite-type tricarboxylate transporter receptor subunit TctC